MSPCAVECSTRFCFRPSLTVDPLFDQASDGLHPLTATVEVAGEVHACLVIFKEQGRELVLALPLGEVVRQVSQVPRAPSGPGGGVGPLSVLGDEELAGLDGEAQVEPGGSGVRGGRKRGPAWVRWGLAICRGGARRPLLKPVELG
jgi:hypothetical protein